MLSSAGLFKRPWAAYPEGSNHGDRVRQQIEPMRASSWNDWRQMQRKTSGTQPKQDKAREKVGSTSPQPDIAVNFFQRNSDGSGKGRISARGDPKKVPLQLLTCFLDAAQARKWHKADKLAKQVLACEATNKLVSDYMPHIQEGLEMRKRRGVGSSEDDTSDEDDETSADEDSNYKDEDDDEEDDSRTAQNVFDSDATKTQAKDNLNFTFSTSVASPEVKLSLPMTNSDTKGVANSPMNSSSPTSEKHEPNKLLRQEATEKKRSDQGIRNKEQHKPFMKYNKSLHAMPIANTATSPKQQTTPQSKHESQGSIFRNDDSSGAGDSNKDENNRISTPSSNSSDSREDKMQMRLAFAQKQLAGAQRRQVLVGSNKGNKHSESSPLSSLDAQSETQRSSTHKSYLGRPTDPPTLVLAENMLRRREIEELRAIATGGDGLLLNYHGFRLDSGSDPGTGASARRKCAFADSAAKAKAVQVRTASSSGDPWHLASTVFHGHDSCGDASDSCGELESSPGVNSGYDADCLLWSLLPSRTHTGSSIHTCGAVGSGLRSFWASTGGYPQFLTIRIPVAKWNKSADASVRTTNAVRVRFVGLVSTGIKSLSVSVSIAAVADGMYVDDNNTNNTNDFNDYRQSVARGSSRSSGSSWPERGAKTSGSWMIPEVIRVPDVSLGDDYPLIRRQAKARSKTKAHFSSAPAKANPGTARKQKREPRTNHRNSHSSNEYEPHARVYSQLRQQLQQEPKPQPQQEPGPGRVVLQLQPQLGGAALRGQLIGGSSSNGSRQSEDCTAGSGISSNSSHDPAMMKLQCQYLDLCSLDGQAAVDAAMRQHAQNRQRPPSKYKYQNKYGYLIDEITLTIEAGHDDFCTIHRISLLGQNPHPD